MSVLTRTQLIQGPSVEPITLSEARAHMRVSHSEEDELIAGLVSSARITVETITRRSLISQKWRLFSDTFPPTSVIKLPHSPVITVESVKYYDTDGELQTFANSNYWVDLVSAPARLMLRDGVSYPDTQDNRPNAVEITYTAGFGERRESIPSPIRHCVKLLVAHLYENPDIVSAGQLNEIPMSCDYLLAPYRVITFF